MSASSRVRSLRLKLSSPYRGSGRERCFIPYDKVMWTAQWPEYHPPFYTAPRVLEAPWADKKKIGAPGITYSWNRKDGDVNRKSYEGKYEIDTSGHPLNPMGRTGIRGRGVLGRWGPNHAVDCLVTRWRNLEGQEKKSEVLLIQRRDNGEWAIPGGMIDPGEEVDDALRREFLEECCDSERIVVDEVKGMNDSLKRFFRRTERKEIYKGYVDDPRNTDNSWMETNCVNYDLQWSPELEDWFGKFLKAGSDAMDIKWVDAQHDMKIYASHGKLIDLFLYEKEFYSK